MYEETIAKTDRLPAPISQEINTLNVLTEKLNSRLDDLSIRLDPILKPPHPMPDSLNAVEQNEGASSLWGDLRRLRAILSTISERIAELTDRLEI